MDTKNSGREINSAAIKNNSVWSNLLGSGKSNSRIGRCLVYKWKFVKSEILLSFRNSSFFTFNWFSGVPEIHLVRKY